MTTKEVLVSMLTDGVGTSFLDSGGTPKFDENGKYVGSEHGYGRHVERNQCRDFEKELSSTVRFSVRDGKLEIEMEHNLYHWLERRLELDNKIDALFHGQFLKEADPNEDKNWLRLMTEFPGWLAKRVTLAGNIYYGKFPPRPKRPVKKEHTKTRRERKLATVKYLRAMECYRQAYSKYRAYMGPIEEDGGFGMVGGIYGEGEPITVNSYNGEDLLSQVIQYVYFTWREKSRYGHRRSNYNPYVILQIHGGADVRGGYSTPHVFQIDSDDDTAIFDHAKGNIYCTGQDHHPAALKIKSFQDAQLALPGVKVGSINFDDCNANWYTDDSCNFYDDGACGRGHTNLEDRECVDLEAEADAAEGKELDEGAPRPGDWRPGVVCVLDHRAYCPKCGALLAASD